MLLLCSVLHCPVLYCTALCCCALYSSALYCTLLPCAALYCTSCPKVLSCAVLFLSANLEEEHHTAHTTLHFKVESNPNHRNFWRKSTGSARGDTAPLVQYWLYVLRSITLLSGRVKLVPLSFTRFNTVMYYVLYEKEM